MRGRVGKEKGERGWVVKDEVGCLCVYLVWYFSVMGFRILMVVCVEF